MTRAEARVDELVVYIYKHDIIIFLIKNVIQIIKRNSFKLVIYEVLTVTRMQMSFREERTSRFSNHGRFGVQPLT
jgi:hypothetical protein